MKPSQVLLFIAGCLLCLGLLCVVLPHQVSVGDRTLRWPTLAEVLGESEESEEILDTLDILGSLDTLGILDTLETPEIPKLQPVAVVIPRVQVDSTTDSRLFLEAFYTALAEAGTRTVRVLHYGDSQIEEDRMTQQIREALQNRYGGAGVGLMPLVQTIPSRTVRQELFMNDRKISPQQGPRRYMVHGFKRDQRADGQYGVMGQMAVMNDSLVSGSEHMTAVCTPLDGRPAYTRWQVFADSSVAYSFVGDTVQLSGRGNVYALSQESDTGIIVDNIPLRGCLGLVFTKMDSTWLSSFYAQQNVRLIIMQFGGNAIPSNKNPGTISGIVKGLREQVRFLRACAPQAAILFIGPSDMLTQVEGEWQTYPMVPYMDRLLRKMALEEQIAYFSLYRWMGGAGSMAHWQEIGLAGSDGVHFSRAGARKAGNAVANWLLEGIKD